MITMKHSAPSSKLSPMAAKKLNNLRLNIDIIGLTMIRITSPFIVAFPALFHQIISVYNFLATFTILTVDPTRLPEAATTRIKQKQSWMMMMMMQPLLITSFGVIIWSFHLTIRPLMLPSISALITICIDELLFRNILQPKLRQLGFNRYLAIIAQSSMYASIYLVSEYSVGLVLIALLLGLINGWFVYTYRSLWPAMTLSFIVHLFILGF